MLRRFAGSTDPRILDRTAKTCLLLPGGPGGPGSPNPLDLATRALRQAPNDANLRAWFSLRYGMALYRREDFKAAIESVQNALSPPSATRHPVATLFLAMANHHLGHDDKAHVQLHEAIHELDRELPNETEGDLTLGIVGVENWLMCQIFRREAEALIVARSLNAPPDE